MRVLAVYAILFLSLVTTQIILLDMLTTVQ
jgi:hypothetical protein